jgi:peptidoglycan/LPS O-acetylase OafA/YrhL
MGLLFLLSGYFVQSSFDRKGLKSFSKDRLIRLAIPLLAFTFVLGPFSYFIGVPHIAPSLLASRGITLPLTWKAYFASIAPGPLWFVALLLIFDFSYAAWRVASGKPEERRASSYPPPTYRIVIAFVLFLAAVTYAVRIIVPMNQYVLFFPTLSYLPQYASFFLIGIMAYRGDWFRKVSASLAERAFAVAVVATLVVIPFTLLLAPTTFLGRGSWQSAVYALYDSTFAVSMSLALIVLFRRFFDFSGRLWLFLSQQSYAVYVIHPPIIIAITAIVLQKVSIEPLLKFVLAAVISVPACFGAAYLVRRIPLVNEVL